MRCPVTKLFLAPPHRFVKLGVIASKRYGDINFCIQFHLRT